MSDSNSNTQLVKNIVAQPVHVVLSKSTRGVYSWEISFYGDDKDQVLKLVQEANSELERKYGGKAEDAE